MQARLLPEARHAIQQYIIKLHEHQATLNAMVARAETLMPYIEEALLYIGVPEDLKYLAIQESRLNPHAVSRSQAVGYWQFKDFTAREVGLIINDTIDERKHLFRSSAGAAIYLSKQYYRHRNWLFAIIAYYEGGSGAIPYIDTAYREKNEICIHANTHWYALRAIAHKLVFEPLIQRRVYALRPIAYQGPPIPAWKLAQDYGLTPDQFLELNPWLRRPILPGTRPSTYYILQPAAVSERPQEPLKALFSPANFSAAYASVPANYRYDTGATDAAVQTSGSLTADLPLPPPSPKGTSTTSSVAAYLPIQKEPYLHQEWAYPPPTFNRRMERWNPFHTSGAPALIIHPRRAHIHIVQQRETLRDIAFHYRRSLDKLMSYNRITNPDSILPQGLRVLLREERPYDEKPVIYHWR
ncbi:MAG: transglycosylase SLT domain-containing protein [Bacteroidia bacterium]|nr:transglycosylase SLT domain-containing protein [Bacteroidia bacterium]MCX7652782.1 transglycosylase SLT domain-containing protein [Bacteroidia bacterium]MDW8417485.1 transglycosylase SLT domain-containing protein [Bacteroidia bacterium]